MGTDNQNSQDGAQNAEKTFTQAELDAIVKDRLKRASEKYSDYDALKEKATKFDELEAANKTELEKANEKLKSVTAELDALKKAQELSDMRIQIANENHVPMEFLTGTTKEELDLQANKIKEMMSATGIPMSVSDGGEVVTLGGKIDNRTSFANWAQQIL
jgi:hypothetical protein